MNSVLPLFDSERDQVPNVDLIVTKWYSGSEIDVPFQIFETIPYLPGSTRPGTNREVRVQKVKGITCGNEVKVSCRVTGDSYGTEKVGGR